MSLKCISQRCRLCAVPGNIWSACLDSRMMTSRVISDLLSQMKEAWFAATIPKFMHFFLLPHSFSFLSLKRADSGFCSKSFLIVRLFGEKKNCFVSKCFSFCVCAVEVSLLKARQNKSLPSNSGCEWILCVSRLNNHYSAGSLWTAGGILDHGKNSFWKLVTLEKQKPGLNRFVAILANAGWKT